MDEMRDLKVHAKCCRKHKSGTSVILSRLSVPHSRLTTCQETLVAPVIEAGTSGTVARNSTTRPQKHRLEVIIKMGLKGIGSEVVAWILLTHNIVNIIMRLWD
jgi:hypothetical protein